MKPLRHRKTSGRMEKVQISKMAAVSLFLQLMAQQVRLEPQSSQTFLMEITLQGPGERGIGNCRTVFPLFLGREASCALTGPHVHRRWGKVAGEENKPVVQDGTAPAAEEGDGQPKRKRKSRWEEPEQVDKSLVAIMPKEIVLPGGIKVCQTESVLSWCVSQLYDALVN